MNLKPLQVAYFFTVACFYVQFNQVGSVSPNSHCALYLVERTFLDLKEKLSEKVQTDPALVDRIIWENIKGLKILVDDDVVQHIPEDQIMTAEFCEVPGAETAPFSGVKPSAVEIKLKF
jgi:hypothetical protein